MSLKNGCGYSEEQNHSKLPKAWLSGSCPCQIPDHLKEKEGAGELAQQVNACVVKLDDLSLVVRAHMVEGEELSLANCSLTSIVAHMNLRSQINKCNTRENKGASQDASTMEDWLGK